MQQINIETKIQLLSPQKQQQNNNQNSWVVPYYVYGCSLPQVKATQIFHALHWDKKLSNPNLILSNASSVCTLTSFTQTQWTQISSACPHQIPDSNVSELMINKKNVLRKYMIWQLKTTHTHTHTHTTHPCMRTCSLGSTLNLWLCTQKNPTNVSYQNENTTDWGTVDREERGVGGGEGAGRRKRLGSHGTDVSLCWRCFSFSSNSFSLSCSVLFRLSWRACRVMACSQ